MWNSPHAFSPCASSRVIARWLVRARGERPHAAQMESSKARCSACGSGRNAVQSF